MGKNLHSPAKGILPVFENLQATGFFLINI
jgi:hypothetical protein